jgi:hypothetical protein
MAGSHSLYIKDSTNAAASANRTAAIGLNCVQSTKNNPPKAVILLCKDTERVKVSLLKGTPPKTCTNLMKSRGTVRSDLVAYCLV